MPSTYTQNLGIELPATGEQANVWGDTVNRNMNTLDSAINGNVQLPLSSSPFPLNIANGAESQAAANKLIIWTGPQTSQGTVQIDWQSTRQHVYFMQNRTTGGFGIAFAQGSGTQFVLRAGYDAVIYADGGGTSANVGEALANPQFTNLQVTGSINGIFSSDAQGNAHLTGGLGVGNPTAIPDPLTINGTGTGGQLRLVQGSYGVILLNDGTTFLLRVTNSGDPYGSPAAPVLLSIGLASKVVTISELALPNGPYVNYIATSASGGFQVLGGSSTALFLLDQSGNAQITGTLITGGQVQVNSGGIKFPDGSVQTTANIVPGAWTAYTPTFTDPSGRSHTVHSLNAAYLIYGSILYVMVNAFLHTTVSGNQINVSLPVDVGSNHKTVYAYAYGGTGQQDGVLGSYASGPTVYVPLAVITPATGPPLTYNDLDVYFGMAGAIGIGV